MPQLLTQPSHALPKKILSHNRTHFLGRMKHNTEEKNVVGTHDPRKKGRSASAQDGAGQCTTPMPQLLPQPSHASPIKTLATVISHAATKQARHGREACCGRINPEENGRLAMEQDGSVLCTTPMPQLLTQPLNACPTKVVHNRTHQLRQRKHDTGGKRVVGDITQEKKDH